MILALALAAALMAADAPPARAGGEPLPPGAPTDSYELSAWCYGALDEYLSIYQKVKPDLRDMDHMFGTPVVEEEPYHADMAAYHVELKLIGDSVTQAEKASPRPIAEDGAAAIRQGRAIWSIAETKPERDLARAWMLWALPDRCDTNARELAQRSVLFGKALNYNSARPPPEPAPGGQPSASTPVDQQLSGPGPAPTDPAAMPPAADMAPAPPPAAGPGAQASPSTDTNVPAPPDSSGAPEAASPSSAPQDAAPTPPAADPGVPPYPVAPPADQPQPTQP
jgi:hypothetical protein